MMPMEDLPNGAQSSEDVPDEAKNPPETSAPSNCCKLLNCCGKTEQQGISRNKIEPVIFQPINDVYLHLGITNSPNLTKLTKMVQLSIPIDAYPTELITLYEQITTAYYQHISKYS